MSFHMLQEIFEQPQTLAATLDLYVRKGDFRPDTTDAAAQWLRRADSMLIVASGSSRHAGLAAEIMFEDFSGVQVDVEYASEYIYRSGAPCHYGGVLVASQSGETADTLAALRKAGTQQMPTLAITNVADSTMASEADVSFPTLAGVERAIPATKSFTGQLLAFWLLTLLAARGRGVRDEAEIRRHLEQAETLPALVQVQLEGWRRGMAEATNRFARSSGFLFLGRAVQYAIAREGALKLKESAYITAEGYPAGELKHGPRALISSSLPLVIIATVDTSDPGSVERYEKSVQLMREMTEQGAQILAIANQEDALVGSLATQMIAVAEASEPLLAIQAAIALQLFAFLMARARGVNVDQPRNLVKSVVAE